MQHFASRVCHQQKQTMFMGSSNRARPAAIEQKLWSLKLCVDVTFELPQPLEQWCGDPAHSKWCSLIKGFAEGGYFTGLQFKNIQVDSQLRELWLAI